jgi:hypothetical protein
MAFIVDIRRQAVMQHLLYKALFELSSDRADFISRLYSKPRPRGLDSASTVAELWDAYWFVETQSRLWERNLVAVRDHLTRARGIPLDSADIASLTYVYEAFYTLGPNITYGGYRESNQNSATSFGSLTAEQDAAGVPRSFLATEEGFRFIRSMHRRNLIIPVVGNFGGPKTIRAVGDYVRSRGETVTAFYVSNVEQYLFQSASLWTSFYESVATLPLDSASVFIRPMAGGGGYRIYTSLSSTSPVTGRVAGVSVGTVGGAPGAAICPILPEIQAFREGRVSTYAGARLCLGSR